MPTFASLQSASPTWKEGLSWRETGAGVRLPTDSPCRWGALQTRAATEAQELSAPRAPIQPLQPQQRERESTLSDCKNAFISAMSWMRCMKISAFRADRRGRGIKFAFNWQWRAEITFAHANHCSSISGIGLLKWRKQGPREFYDLEHAVSLEQKNIKPRIFSLMTLSIDGPGVFAIYSRKSWIKCSFRANAKTINISSGCN